MSTRMKIVWTLLTTSLAGVFIIFLFWLAHRPESLDRPHQAGDVAATDAGQPPITLGLIPERDVYAQRKRYRALADYLGQRLGRPVKLAMVNTYEGVLSDLAEKRIDGAFLGSLVTTLAMDRLGARVMVKPELPGGVSTYHGVIFTREDSTIRDIGQLPGRTIGMVRTTTAGHLLPGCVMMKLGFLDQPDKPKIRWLGTHDEVIREVASGRIDVGAAKNTRLNALAASHPDWKLRTLIRGKCVPNNALVIRGDLADTLGIELKTILLEMPTEPAGRSALEALGVVRFIECLPQEYATVYDMFECIDPAWDEIGVAGPRPRRPNDWPQPKPDVEYKCYDVSF